MSGYSVFDTALGPCGIAWTVRGVAYVQLPEKDAPSTERRIAERTGFSRAEPPARIKGAIAGIRELMATGSADFSAVALDMEGVPRFHRAIYESALRIPPGAVRTYGELAIEAGSPGAARAVGQAMAKNPLPLIVPCHRVLASSGKLGGFSAYGGVETKRHLLAVEGAGEPLPAIDNDKAVRYLKKKDRRMAALIDAVGPFTLKAHESLDPFASLMEAIVYQQLNGRAASTILERVKALFPGREFPTPGDLVASSVDALRGAGLSQAKTASLKDLAEKTLSGVVPSARAILRLDDEEIVKRLTAVRGIGRWTAEMLLIFTLGRPDVLPVDDFGVRNGFAAAYGRESLPAPKELLAFGERWRPWRTAASWYLWRALDVPGREFVMPLRTG